MKTRTKQRKSVKINLRKNKTRRFNKKENTLRKRRQQRKSNKKQQRKSNKRQQKIRQRKNLRKTMKGGAIPFSEIGEVYGNIKHSFNDAIEVFKDTPTSAPNNPALPNTNPNVSHQFLRTEAASQKFAAPDIMSHYQSSYN